ncbi:uncharacterized secreted protein [Puniceibacterium sp. IMCC21224]|nr:uncharacterized secreted protein [Puniceibacterium sp. IMCC21224]
MRSFAVIFIALWAVCGGAVQAQQSPVVVELYTSQGCSSCPSADALLARLSERDDVITLALHVDYWDYLGWKDEFAKAMFTKRQRGYARAMHSRSIYTPQMVINGKSNVVGNRSMDVAEVIKAHKSRRQKVHLTLARNGSGLSIRADAPKSVGPTEIQLVRYLPSATVQVGRGENAGKTITYTSIVSDWDVVGTWNGQGTYDKSVALGEAGPVVVLVQRPDHGAILAAARLR